MWRMLPDLFVYYRVLVPASYEAKSKAQRKVKCTVKCKA